ncbi:MAG: polysaccharide deacetylase family protein [Elusimicrobium sp.]|jgi:peptidoglycan/xylan/chitin deacetylase (PgdA/CDA1 family)|nr:polysaccharide deacetylase family protein [Elusimicrobium sp.]
MFYFYAAAVLILITAVVIFSAKYNWWKKPKDGLVILLYHHIGTPPANSKNKRNWVSPENFTKQLDWLASNGYTSINFDGLLKIMAGKAQFPPKPVIITFDDGYKDVYQNAFPLLKERKMKAAALLVQEAVGKYNFWQDPAREVWQDIMTEEQVKEILKSGVFDYGSHGLTHKNLAKLESDAAEYEILESAARLANTFGAQCAVFAYPYGGGAEDEEINSFISAAGYKISLSSEQGINPLPLNTAKPLKRIPIRRRTDMLQFKLKITRG